MTLLIYFGVQAIIGVIAIEFAWARTKRFRQVDERRDAMFPQFRRNDAVHWARWKFYPGAMFLMPTRLILLVLDGIFLTAIVKILSVGHNFKKEPMKSGFRKWMIAFMYHVCCTFFLWVCGIFYTSHKNMDADYSAYLGIDYKKEERKPKRTSTLVSNHTSWLDNVALIKTIRPAFSPSAEFRNLPLLSNLIDALDSIYIPRGGSEEKKAKALAAIKQRQELIEETGKFSPFLIFAEGGTSNGTGLVNFKKGAFFAEKTVRPLFIKYGYHTLNPAFDTIEFLPLAILTLSWGFMTCEVTILPDFTPNEYLF